MTGIDRASIVARLRAAGCVFAEDEAEVLLESARDEAALDAMVDRRVSGFPLEYVVGWAEFCGLRIRVEPGVFVPRRRSEFLVERAAALAPADPVVLDLCCGSAALGLALRERVAGVALYAADIDPVAVRCARTNVGESGRVFCGDLFSALPERLRGRVNVLLANVPYVPAWDIGLMPPEARDHEPRAALDGGTDGLDVLRRVSAHARDWLAPGGMLFTETSAEQAVTAAGILRLGGLQAETADCEERNATVVIGVAAVQAR